MYRLYVNPPLAGPGFMVYRVEDGMWIPMVDGNTDYGKYLKWVENGGVPEVIPYPRPPGM